MVRLGLMDGSTGICLTEEEYNQLFAMREKVTSFFQQDDGSPSSCFFEGSPHKRIQLQIYQERKMLNIREMVPGNGKNYGMLYPTKNGFAIGAFLWDVLLEKHVQVVTFLTEAKRVHRVIKENVINQLTDSIKIMCNGCIIDHPSQLQHDCIMLEWAERVDANYPNAVASLNIESLTSVFNTNSFLSFQFCKQMVSSVVCTSKQFL